MAISKKKRSEAKVLKTLGAQWLIFTKWKKYKKIFYKKILKTNEQQENDLKLLHLNT